MITVMIHAKVKKDKISEFFEILDLLAERASKKGCITYSCNQNTEIETDFVLFEQWESQEALDTHISEIFEILGPARPGEPIPSRLMDVYEEVKPVYYKVVGKKT